QIQRAFEESGRSPRIIHGKRPPFQVITKYADLPLVSAFTAMPGSLKTSQQLVDFRSRLTPLDFVIDCETTEQFVLSVIMLRAKTVGIALERNISIATTGVFRGKHLSMAYMPYFERANLFAQYV